VERLTQGSAWRERILNFVMAAEADGTIKELLDEQLRRRQEELCRTEDRYIELSEALRNAGVEFKDGRLWVERDGRSVTLEDAVGSVPAR
jgi:hypothetical protein